MHLIKLGHSCEVSLFLIKLQSTSSLQAVPTFLKHTKDVVSVHEVIEAVYPLLEQSDTPFVHEAVGQLGVPVPHRGVATVPELAGVQSTFSEQLFRSPPGQQISALLARHLIHDPAWQVGTEASVQYAKLPPELFPQNACAPLEEEPPEEVVLQRGVATIPELFGVQAALPVHEFGFPAGQQTAAPL